jgi:hypothetical protein
MMNALEAGAHVIVQVGPLKGCVLTYLGTDPLGRSMVSWLGRAEVIPQANGPSVLALRVPPYAVRKQLREQTLKVGRTRSSR